MYCMYVPVFVHLYIDMYTYTIHLALFACMINRVYLMYSRGPGFLAVVWFVNSPPPPPLPPPLVSKLSLFLSLPVRRRFRLTDGRGGGGMKGAQSYDGEKAWSSIIHEILSDDYNDYFPASLRAFICTLRINALMNWFRAMNTYNLQITYINHCFACYFGPGQYQIKNLHWRNITDLENKYLFIWGIVSIKEWSFQSGKIYTENASV